MAIQYWGRSATGAASNVNYTTSRQSRPQVRDRHHSVSTPTCISWLSGYPTSGWKLDVAHSKYPERVTQTKNTEFLDTLTYCKAFDIHQDYSYWSSAVHGIELRVLNSDLDPLLRTAVYGVVSGVFAFVHRGSSYYLRMVPNDIHNQASP